MCGIVGIVSSEPFSVKGELLPRLSRLEYRGYDSAGYATSGGLVKKSVGEISRLVALAGSEEARAAISHTRWATHGGVTEGNAHPHSDSAGDVFLVHNGIISNYAELKEELAGMGCRFAGETDSEVVAHFFSERFSRGDSFGDAAREFMRRAEGTFAILMLRRGEDRIYALKRDSPLTLGILGSGFVLASDIYAFSDKTGRALFFDDDEYAVVDAQGYHFFGRDGKPVEKEVRRFDLSSHEASKEQYAHFMLKEIHEQPEAAERLIASLSGEQAGKLEKLAQLARSANRVIFTAAGTSYFASLLGVYFLNKRGVMAHTLIASEFENYMYVDKDSLVIAVSQSGETMDVVSALKFARSRGATIASIVNVPHSTVQRMSSVSVDMNAGQEVCVAATKTFTNEVVVMLALASKFGFDSDLPSIPGKIRETIWRNEEKVKQLSGKISCKNDVYVLGRGLSYPSAREFAHKMKEIAYVHAEGMMGGELKHGTLALIEEGTPVFSLIPRDDSDMLANTHEVRARGAAVITVSGKDDADFPVPTGNHGVFSVLSVVIGQLFAYYVARERGLPIDKPRNLAKSVTVK
jgi:glucosamine--fructose-6-phosphate aminotransferase (isomerizing)